MKFLQLFFVALTCIAVTLVTEKYTSPQLQSAPTNETAFERVLRTGTIRCGYGIFTPELVKNPTTGELSGYDYDIMAALGHVLGLKVVWPEETGWGLAEQGLTSGRYDIFCGGVWPTPNRTKSAFYSRPFIYTPLYAFFSPSSPKATSATDAAWINRHDTVIAVLPNTALDTLTDFKFPLAKKFDLSALSSDGDILMAVATHKADAGISSYDGIKKYMDANPGQIQVIDKPVLYAPAGLLLPQDDRLKHMVDFALTYLLDTGTVREIFTKDLPDKQHGWRYPAAGYEQ